LPSKNSKPLKKRTNSGLFITLEGGDGAGKSLLIARLEAELKKRSLPLLVTRNPGGTPLGERIRDLILHQKAFPVSSRCELLLFLADRAHHVETLLLPALREGRIVICDRFNDSTMAYQAAGRGLDLQQVKALSSFSAQGLSPDLTLYLDVDPAIGLKRIRKSKQNRLDLERLAFHQKVRKAYLKIALEEKERVRVLDAHLSPDEVFQQAMIWIDQLMHLFTPRCRQDEAHIKAVGC